MVKFLFKTLIFIVFLGFIYDHFSRYGEVNFRAFGFDATTSVSIVAVAIILFVAIISYVAFIFRFIANIPNKIANAYIGMKDRKVRELLFEIINLKEAGKNEEASALFTKNRKQLLRKKYALIKLLNYKFSKENISHEELDNSYVELSRNNINSSLILKEFILPNFYRNNFNILEEFASRIKNDRNSKPIYCLVKSYLELDKKHYDDATKFAKKAFSLDAISEQNFSYLKSEILCSEAEQLIKNQLYSKANKKLLEAFSIDPRNENILNLLKLMPAQELDKEKYNAIIEKKWQDKPIAQLAEAYLRLNSDLSQGEMLDLTEKLLNINSGNQAKMIIATEYYIYGFEKQAAKLIKDIDSDGYSISLKKAIIFREALSTENKPEKIAHFKKLIFDKHAY